LQSSRSRRLRSRRASARRSAAACIWIGKPVSTCTRHDHRANDVMVSIGSPDARRQRRRFIRYAARPRLRIYDAHDRP
jgi:hypothetical protein